MINDERLYCCHCDTEIFFEDETIGIIKINGDEFGVISKIDGSRQSMRIPHASPYFDDNRKYFFCRNKCIKDFMNEQKPYIAVAIQKNNPYGDTDIHKLVNDLEDIC